MGGSIAQRGLVEASFRLDVTPLVRTAQEHGGSALLILERPGGRLCDAVGSVEIAVRVGPEAGTLVLRYIAMAWDGTIVPVRDVVELTSRPQHFGGRSWFACCPRWNVRVKSLCLPYGGVRFVSRQAARLAYASTRPSARDRDMVRAQRIRRKLGGPAFWNLAEPFPERPRYMRHARYDALRSKADASLAAYNEASLPRIERWLDAIGRRRAE